jgi:pimeloyl-ACP methyl ester carboxylesterase
VATFETADGVEIRYEILGNGPPLLACHGGPSNVCDTLMRDLRALAADFTLIFHDYRGSGRSAPASEPTYTFARLADDLNELRAHLGLGAVPVLAHSMGGLMALEFALRHPEECERLVLVGVTPSMTPGSIALPTLRALGAARAVRMAAVVLWYLLFWSWRSPSAARTAAMYAPTDVMQEPRKELRRVVAAAHPEVPVENDNAPQLRRLLESTDLRSELGRIRCPVLVLYGSRDAMMVVGSRMLESGLARVEVVRLDDVGHEVFVEESEESLRQIRRFLA